MHTSTLEPLRPSRAVAVALLDLIRKDAVARLRRGAKLWDGTEDALALWWKEYHQTLQRYEADGEMRFNGGILSIQRGPRLRTSESGFNSVNLDEFDELDDTSIDSVTIHLGQMYSSVEKLEIDFTPDECRVRLEEAWEERVGPGVTIEEIEEVLRAAASPWVSPAATSVVPQPFTVFVGHGNDDQWRDLRDDLRYHHGFEVEAFEAAPRSGNTIKDVLEGMAAASSVAVLVLTKSNEMADGTWQGRQNVIHEIGYFQGRLGWNRAIIVVENGVVLPSNFDGTQQVRFPPGVIKAASGDVVAILNSIRNSGS